jgi:branched-chain amino acid transport system permease protein
MGISTASVVASVYALSGVVGIPGLALCIGNTRTLTIALGSPSPSSVRSILIGGLRSIDGTAAGRLGPRCFEALIGTYLSTQWSDVIIFSVLIIVLIFRPDGIAGRKDVVRA